MDTKEGSATPRSKLDALPKEDLLKLLKRMQLKVVKHQEVVDELAKLKLARSQVATVSSEERHVQTVERESNQQDTQTDLPQLNLSVMQLQTYFPGVESPTKSIDRKSMEESAIQTERNELAAKHIQTDSIDAKTKSQEEKEVQTDLNEDISTTKTLTLLSEGETQTEPLLIDEIKEENGRLSGQLVELQSICDRVAVEKADLCSKLVSLETTLSDAASNHTKELKSLQEQLETMAKNNEQPQFLSLEMEDYERGIKNMQQQIKSMEEETARLNGLVESKNKEIESNLKEMEGLRNQKTKSVETEKKLKQALLKAKKENETLVKTMEEKDAAIEELKLKAQETEMSADTLKMDLSTALSQRENFIRKLQEDLEEKDRRSRWVETERTKMQMEMEAVQNELVNTKHEYETYKVRVHNVLKTHRNSAEEDSWAIEKDHLTKTVELVQEKLKDVGSKYATLQAESGRLQEEVDSLSQRLRDVQSCANLKEKSLRTQLDTLTSDAAMESEKNAQIIRNLTVQSEQIRTDFQDQIAKMNREHSELVQVYDERIHHLEQEVANYKRQLIAEPKSQDVNSHKSSNATSDDVFLTNRQFDDLTSSFNPLLTERRPAEGSESFSATTPTRFAIASPTSPFALTSPLPLSELLRSSDTMSVTSNHTNDSNAKTATDDHHSSAQLEKALKRIDHLSEVLNETEGNNARLAEQAKVLKEEIRRLERNQEREKHLANTEYLKNVVLKFMALKPGDERSQLILVLTTMLRLSHDEVAFLSSYAKGESPNSKNSSSGWSNYMHRWSGMS